MRAAPTCEEEFQAIGLSDGRVYTVRAWRYWTNIETSASAYDPRPSLLLYRLADGLILERIDDETFDVPGGQRLKRAAPKDTSQSPTR